MSERVLDYLPNSCRTVGRIIPALGSDSGESNLAIPTASSTNSPLGCHSALSCPPILRLFRVQASDKACLMDKSAVSLLLSQQLGTDYTAFCVLMFSFTTGA